MNNTISFKILLTCQNYLDRTQRVSTWATYQTKIDERTRFYCYTCELTFNSVKIPFWKDNLHEMVWILAQLSVEDKISIHSLSEKWNIPETSLRNLITELKDVLASSFERVKQLDELENIKSGRRSGEIKILVYDEGFLKLLGIQAYLIFTLDVNGKMTQMGGLDVIISDISPVILPVTWALRHDLMLIMQIHQNDGKRARIIKLETVPNKKRMLETTIELHTGSLLLSSESELTVSKKFIHPKKFSGSSSHSQKTNYSKKRKEDQVKRSGISKPIESLKTTDSKAKSKPKLLKSQKIVLNTGNELGVFELSYLNPLSFVMDESIPTLQEIQGMITLVQNILPNQYITSNRAEVFNDLHDNILTYQGKKTLEHANRDLLAWAVMKFFPKMTKKLIQNHEWKIPYSILTGLWPLLISSLKI